MHRRSSRCCWRCTLHRAAHAAVVAALQQLHQHTVRKHCARLKHPSRRPPPSTVYVGDADADVCGLPVGRRVQTRIQQDRILLLEPLALFLHRRAPKSGTRWSHGHERDSNYSVVRIRHRKTHLTKVIEI